MSTMKRDRQPADLEMSRHLYQGESIDAVSDFMENADYAQSIEGDKVS